MEKSLKRFDTSLVRKQNDAMKLRVLNPLTLRASSGNLKRIGYFEPVEFAGSTDRKRVTECSTHYRLVQRGVSQPDP